LQNWHTSRKIKEYPGDDDDNEIEWEFNSGSKQTSLMMFINEHILKHQHLKISMNLWYYFEPLSLESPQLSSSWPSTKSHEVEWKLAIKTNSNLHQAQTISLHLLPPSFLMTPLSGEPHYVFAPCALCTVRHWPYIPSKEIENFDINFVFFDTPSLLLGLAQQKVWRACFIL